MKAMHEIKIENENIFNKVKEKLSKLKIRLCIKLKLKMKINLIKLKEKLSKLYKNKLFWKLDTRIVIGMLYNYLWKHILI